MQQLNVNDYYELGKVIEQIERDIARVRQELEEMTTLFWPLFSVKWKLGALLHEPCALLPASQRAIRAILRAIGEIIPDEMEDFFKLTKDQIQVYQLTPISTAITNFESVFSNDMPEMSTFSVAQIGIYRTEDLIHKSFLQIDEGLRHTLLPLALSDITEAGKCLAFRVPTAAAFHMSRAIETGMNQYYEALTGKAFELKDAAKNWGAKTEALRNAGADANITEFLVHIRKAYRNPITHPDVILEPSEAFNFNSQAISVISMMLAAVKIETEKRQPSLPGLSAISRASPLIGSAPTLLSPVPKPSDDSKTA